MANIKLIFHSIKPAITIRYKPVAILEAIIRKAPFLGFLRAIINPTMDASISKTSIKELNLPSKNTETPSPIKKKRKKSDK
jgi:hypothetical protein